MVRGEHHPEVLLAHPGVVLGQIGLQVGYAGLALGDVVHQVMEFPGIGGVERLARIGQFGLLGFGSGGRDRLHARVQKVDAAQDQALAGVHAGLPAVSTVGEAELVVYLDAPVHDAEGLGWAGAHAPAARTGLRPARLHHGAGDVLLRMDGQPGQAP